MQTYIIGAGMAGLLAANMLARHKPVIIEQQEELPHNHSAVLRFRTNKVSEVLGIEFKKVTMIKDTLRWTNPVADALAYSRKVSGFYRTDRSIIAGLTSQERWIAPHDLIKRMAEGCNIAFKKTVDERWLKQSKEPIISTIPMPALARLLNYPFPFHPFPPENFNSIPIVNLRCRIKDCEAYASLYIPHPHKAASRISITGDEMIVELPFDRVPEKDEIKKHIYEAAELFGIDKMLLFEMSGRLQPYAKIVPIPDTARKQFMFWATEQYNIYSLGRYATWRPSLLLDDLVQDIRLIERWMGYGSYEAKKERKA